MTLASGNASAHKSTMKFVNRNGHLYLRRRVPKRYEDVEPRSYVWMSMHTDLEDVARRKAPGIWDEMLEAWEAKMHGDSDDAEERFDAAKNLAAIRGFKYLPASRVARLPEREFLDRLSKVSRSDGTIDMKEADALLGGAEEPVITLSRALTLFWSLSRDRIDQKSEDQKRRWRSPRIKAMNNLIGLIGDIPLADLDADHMLDFRAWWMDRIEAEGLTKNSANKDLTHLSNVLRTVNKMKRLGLNLPLSDLSFTGGEKKTRPAFSVEWIKTKILAPGALDRLNVEARAILLGMVNTGYRPSEGQGLLPEHIRLDAAVPHISIEPVGRQLKNQYSKRKIPLLGISLEAFKAFPEGFPRYRDSSSLSATINKFLRNNGLLETPAHSMYSLRHAFEDRMLAAGIDERVRRDVFGHALNRERYGSGATLEMMQKLLEPVAL